VGSYRITGWATVVKGVAAACLALLDLPWGGRLINLAIGALIAFFGALLLVACKLAVRKAVASPGNK